MTEKDVINSPGPVRFSNPAACRALLMSYGSLSIFIPTAFVFT